MRCDALTALKLLWMQRSLAIFATVLLCAGHVGCARQPVAPPGPEPPAWVGSWRAVLASPGGELPFALVIRESEDGLEAAAVTAGHEEPFSAVRIDGDRVVLEFDWYDSEITATLSDDGERLSGTWRKTIPSGDSTMPFSAARGDSALQRFRPLAETDLEPGSPSLADLSGVWAVEITDEDGTEPARGEFEQKGARVTGTFLTPTGDYRFLEGSFEQGVLRLSTFDGGHAFLFRAVAQPDGSLAGDFWSRDSYHATWRGERTDSEAAVLPDAWQAVGLTNSDGKFSFAFPDLDGDTVSLGDPRFEDKVVLVNIFGSWCPNCNDEAPFLADWYSKYREAGLEVVGLAYEFTGDAERDRRQLRRFRDRYGIEYPLLLAGTSDKQAAAETLPDLTAVVAYPTSLFIGRDGRVRRIYSGFSGPGTGTHHEALVAELEGLIQQLLAEPV